MIIISIKIILLFHSSISIINNQIQLINMAMLCQWVNKLKCSRVVVMLIHI